MPLPRSPHRISAVMRAGLPAAVLVLLAGCGSSSAKPAETAAASADAAAAPAAGSFDPCALLTKEEVQAALGWEVAKAGATVNGDLGSCMYESEKSNMASPFEQLTVGVMTCFTNMACSTFDMPKSFSTSSAMADARKKAYQETDNAKYLDMVTITPVEGLGVPAIMHDMATLLSLEMSVENGRIAYVASWGSAEATRSLAEKVLARVR
jgi:hypothetical protein